MDDVVGIKVRQRGHGTVGFVTWGRIFDAVDDAELLGVIRAHLPSVGISEPDSLELCNSLGELRSAEYFYEALIEFCWNRPPFGDNYEAWRAEMQRKLHDGREIYFVGSLEA